MASREDPKWGLSRPTRRPRRPERSKRQTWSRTARLRRTRLRIPPSPRPTPRGPRVLPSLPSQKLLERSCSTTRRRISGSQSFPPTRMSFRVASSRQRSGNASSMPCFRAGTSRSDNARMRWPRTCRWRANVQPATSRRPSPKPWQVHSRHPERKRSSTWSGLGNVTRPTRKGLGPASLPFFETTPSSAAFHSPPK